MSVAPEDTNGPEPTPTPIPEPTPDNQYVEEAPKPDSVPPQGDTTGSQTTKP